MKTEKPLTKRFAPWIIALVVLAALIVIATPTIAYYLLEANSGAGGEEYFPAESGEPSFNLDFNNKEMKNVSITVEDNGYPVYVRVAIIITWQKPAECANPADCDCVDCTECVDNVADETVGAMECPKCNGEADIYYIAPVQNEDYTIDFNTSGWELVGDYYYCTSPVASGKTTAVLINSCALIESGADIPDGYVLNVEIIVQTVQAIGATDDGNVPAWKDAWKIDKEF